MIAASATGEAGFPPDTQSRIAEFTELAATAIANAEAHVEPDVIIQPNVRLAGVDAHPHTHLDALRPTPGGKRSLRAYGGGDRIARPREGDEKRVPLGVDLAAVVLVECGPQQPLMLAEHLGIAGAQPRQQPRRTLDVAEQKRDGATRKLRHTHSYAQSPLPVKCHATARDPSTARPGPRPPCSQQCGRGNPRVAV